MARCGGETKVGNCIRQRLGHGETRTAPDTSILGGAGRSQTVPMTFCSRDADVGANAGRNELAVDEECKGLQLSCAIPTSRMMLRRPRRVASLSRGGSSGLLEVCLIKRIRAAWARCATGTGFSRGAGPLPYGVFELFLMKAGAYGW